MRFMVISGEKSGAFSGYCTHAASMTSKLPDNVSIMGRGLMEPLVMAMHAYELPNAKLSEIAVVLGVGCINLVTLMSLRAKGVSEIYVVDVLGKYLEKAKELGTVRVFNSRNENTEELVSLYPPHEDEVIKVAIKM